MQHLIIGFLMGGAILAIEQADRQIVPILTGVPITSETRWISADAYNRAGEFLSECESRTGCFTS